MTIDKIIDVYLFAIKNVIGLVSIVDCQMEVEMAPISDSVTCLVKDTCTSVSCCVDIGFMKTSFEAYLTLDACNYWLDVGIEKLSFNLSLKDVTFGICLHWITFLPHVLFYKVFVFCTDFNFNFKGFSFFRITMFYCTKQFLFFQEQRIHSI